ncbi:hypothetical protein LR48_Vigan02g081800 [Vigna angularis]|uniref:Protein kinase domain-containing protein n=1 Tax=Phaseolus angularis TaxID=3914 RepID=A0A0L9TVP4_PHAAN|nr:hypothetical protein LR48_Vigan02g081800 [Vigna angularis]
MDSPGSIQGEREFHNELTLCSNLKSPFVISLLDEDFGAKIGDFGLARVKAVEDLGMVEEKKEGVVEIAVEEFGVTEEGESVSVVDVDRSPESCPVRAVDYSDASPVGGDKLSVVSDGCFESVDSENVNLNKKKGGGSSGRDWCSVGGGEGERRRGEKESTGRAVGPHGNEFDPRH